MEGALIAIAVFGGLIFIGWMVKRSDERIKERFSSELHSKTQTFHALLAEHQMPILDPVNVSYRPISGEIIHAVRKGVKDNRTGVEGRILVTSKAFVFESSSRTDRFPLSSITNIELALDGFSIRKRTGPVRPFLTGESPEFLALVNAISLRLN